MSDHPEAPTALDPDWYALSNGLDTVMPDGTRVTAAVTPDPWDELAIPDFLRRNLDGSFVIPREAPSPGAETPTALETPPLPLPAPAPEVTTEQIMRAEKKRKERARLDKFRDKRAHIAALAAGMVWRDGRMVHPDSMSKSEYARVMRELPTESMKRMFAHDYSEKVR